MKPTRTMIILLAVVTVIGISIGTFTYLHRAVSEQVYAYDCGKIEYKPTSLTPYCADAGVGVSGIRWERWSAEKATGTGKFGINLCEPTCSAGKWKSADVTVILTKSVLDKGKRVLTRIDFETVDGKNLPLSDKPTNGWDLQTKPL